MLTKRWLSPILILSTLIAGIFLAEIIAMVVVYYLAPHSYLLATLIDAATMVVLIFPLAYFMVFRGLMRLLFARLRAEERLQETIKVFESIFSTTHVLFAYLDAQFNFVRVNRAYADMDGRPPEYFPGKNHFGLYPHPENEAIFRGVVETGEPFYILEKPFEYPENPERGVTYWDWSLEPVHDAKGRVVGLILALIDRTRQKREQLARARAEEELLHNEERQRAKLESILNAMPEGVYISGQDRQIEYINPVLLNAFGPVGDRLCYQYFQDLDHPCPWCENERVFAGEHIKEELSYERTGRSYELYSTAIANADGRQSKLKIFHDITERRQSQADLERSFQELQVAKEAERDARLTAEVFSAASQAFTQSLEMDTVFKQMLNFLQRLMPYDTAQVLLLEDDTHFSVRATQPPEPQTAVEASPMQPSRLMASYPYLVEIIIADRPVNIPNTATYPHWRSYTSDPVAAWLGVPISAGGNVIGFLGMQRVAHNPFTLAEARLAEALIGQGATAVQNAWLFEQVRTASERLQSLSHHLVDVQESERRHIARELHDESGQMLTSIMVNLQLLEKNAASPDYVAAKAAEIGAYLQSALKNLQQLAMSLRPATLDHLGLAPALRQFAQTTSEKRGLTVLFEAVGIDERLPANIETTLYRVAQESINNVIRHARASQADILLQSRDRKLVLIVEDNGIGFIPSAVDERIHNGIFGMRERVEMLGGKLTIESEPGRGATVLVELPYDYQNPDR
jgi:PAS domain S-box-containing protein